MTTIERLRELERAATAVYERATKLEYDTGDGREGDVRVWSKNTAGRCVAVFRGENAQPTADAYIATRNALPAMLAVIEAAEELADGVDCNDHCTARGGGACTCGMEALTGKVYAALAAFREVRE